MKKASSRYVCSQCGYVTLRWIGKCPQCESWESFSEESVSSKKDSESFTSVTLPVTLEQIEMGNEHRIVTNISEFDRVLGGGFIPGSVVLLGGEPGIGKSTLVLQAANTISGTVLYVSGEESLQQIKMRSCRLNINSTTLLFLAETNLRGILHRIKETRPVVVIIDSIQTMQLEGFDQSAGTVTQIRECTAALLDDAKKNGYAVVVIGHVTKDGTLAGPKIIEHIVDAVLQFEGESNHSFRIVRASKNRFGSTNEIGVFEMHEEGLSEVKNPSELFLSGRKNEIAGSIVSASYRGSRSILVEVQALVTPSYYGNPQRVTTGFDNRRLSILLAVLEKRAGKRLSAHDVFVNIAGGIRLEEPSADLAVCFAVLSSLLDSPVPPAVACAGEVGLGGELRSIAHAERRIGEAEKLGFKRIVIPESNLRSLKGKFEIEIIGAAAIHDAFSSVLPRK